MSKTIKAGSAVSLRYKHRYEGLPVNSHKVYTVEYVQCNLIKLKGCDKLLPITYFEVF